MQLAKTASTEVLIFTNLLAVRYSQTFSGTQVTASKPSSAESLLCRYWEMLAVKLQLGKTENYL